MTKELVAERVQEGKELPPDVRVLLKSLDGPKIRLLELVFMRCGCESYYNYHCMLCTEFVNTKNKPHWHALIELDLISYGDYSPYDLTKLGRNVVEEMMRTGL